MSRTPGYADTGASAPGNSSRTVTFTNSPRVSAGGAPAGRGSGRDDPAHLLKDFDSKLNSIHEVLSRYQTERTAQARGLPVPPPGAPGHSHSQGSHGGASAAGGGGGGSGGGAGQEREHRSGGGGGSRRLHTRKLDVATVLDEEVFVRHVLTTPRRVRSAASGASRALSARIEYYRCHRDKAQEKAARARQEQLAAQRESTGGVAGGVHGPQINFIEANRRSIVPYALPPNLQLTLEALREEGLSTLGVSHRRTGSSGSSVGYDTGRTGATGRPWSAMPGSVRSSVVSYNGGGSSGGGAGYMSPGPSPGGGGGRSSSRGVTWTSGGSPLPSPGHGPAGAGVHVAWLQPTASVDMARDRDWGQPPQRSSGGSAASAAPSGVLPSAAEPTARSPHAWEEDGGGATATDGDGDGDGGLDSDAEAGVYRDDGGVSPTLFLTEVDVPPSMLLQNTPSGGRDGPGPSSAGLGPPGGSCPSPSGSQALQGGGGGAASRYAAASTGYPGDQPVSSWAYGSPGSQPPYLYGPVRPTTATATSRQTDPGRISLTSLPSRPATAGGSGGGAGSGGGGGMRSPYGSSYGGPQMRASSTATGDGASMMTVYGNVDPRRLRLAMSSRPASGGSPTRRLEYVAEQAARRAERTAYAAEVRQRAAALDAERRRTIAQAAELRAAQRREEEARLAAARAEGEKQDRQRQWTGIVGLCSKLTFLADRVTEDRRLRALRALRKESAVKIAAWYKSVLTRRRQRDLMDLVQRLRDLIRPYLAMQRIIVRQRCAQRIVAFLQYTRTSNMAVVGVRKLKAGIEVLQTAWRNALLVRNLQRSALYNQLTRLEREIVTANKRAERNLQMQMMRLGKSVNIMEPDSVLMPLGFGFGLGSSSFRSHRTAGSAAAAAAGYEGGGGGSGGASTLGVGAGLGYGGGSGGLMTAPSMDRGGGGGGGGAAVDGAATSGPGGGGGGRPSLLSTRQYDRSRLPGRGVLHDPGEEEDDVLRGHLEMVPREVREQVVHSFLVDARREHRLLLEQYSADKQLYAARKPIEEMRQKMLRDAGLKVENEIKAPVMPHMRIIYPRAKLRELLRRAVDINQTRLAAAEERRLQEAAAGYYGSTGGGPGGSGGPGTGGGHSWLYAAERTGGGVAWADQAGGGGSGGADRRLANLASRSAALRRSVSRTSQRAPSHKTIKLPPPPPPAAASPPASPPPQHQQQPR